MFLKTHKTGSSTVTNILNRYGDTRDLMFALPSSKESFSLKWPHPFTVAAVARASYWKAPNILCNHARYNKVSMNTLFPKETTRYITLLREPTQHFESVFNFFRLKKHFKQLRYVSSTLEKFLQNATSYLAQPPAEGVTGASFLNLIKNPLLFELGLDIKYHGNFTAVENYILFLRKEFDLVLLMEYFDESLVLLKRRFCWKIEDILYFKLNERKNIEKQELSSKAKELILKWNSGDVLLYEVFNQTLWKTIKEEGSDFYTDLEVFRKELLSINNACLKEGNFLTKPYTGRLVQGYKVKANISKELNETCNKMIMNEIPYLDYHRQKISKRFKDMVNKIVNEPDLY